MKKWISLFSVVVIFSGMGALAQITSDPSPTPTASASPDATPAASPSVVAQANPLDQLNTEVALNLLHHINDLEVSQSQSALGNLQTPSAQAFAQNMITEHQTNDQQIATLAAQEGAQLYGFQPSTFENAANNQLQQIAAADFDRAFLQLQIQGHERALQNVQQMQAVVTDPEVKAALDAAIPIIQKHRADAAAALAQPGAQPSASPSVQATPEPTATPSPAASEDPSATPTIVPIV